MDNSYTPRRVDGKLLDKTYQRYLGKYECTIHTLIVSMSDMIKATIAPSTECPLVYELAYLPATPFQPKTPEFMSMSRTRSLINTEEVKILIFETSSYTQPPLVLCP